MTIVRRFESEEDGGAELVRAYVSDTGIASVWVLSGSQWVWAFRVENGELWSKLGPPWVAPSLGTVLGIAEEIARNMRVMTETVRQLCTEGLPPVTAD